MKEKQMQALKDTMRPEFINRIDDIIIFRRLEKDALKQITELLLNTLAKRLTEKNIVITYTEAVKDYILEKGTDYVYGARPLKRTIQHLIEDKLSEDIISNKIKDGNTVIIDRGEEGLTFKIEHVNADQTAKK
jgi:ATP-dependent Clp protease ATP-binding subunit ClpC